MLGQADLKKKYNNGWIKIIFEHYKTIAKKS